MNKMPKRIRYVNVSIPEGLAKSIDVYIKGHPELDLRSRAQVVNFALRKLFTGKK
ncbi:MAG: hypothetical protein ABIH25_05665 [Candidatus Woesearchaeota archaeon]